MIDAEHHAIAALESLGHLGDAEGRNIYDEALNRALDPLRTCPAVEVICAMCAFGRRLAYMAIDKHAAYVAATQDRAKPRARLGGMSDLASPPPSPVQGFAGWIQLADGGATSVRLVDRPANNAGYPLRLKFICRDCGAETITTNTRRLRLILAAYRDGVSTIRL